MRQNVLLGLHVVVERGGVEYGLTSNLPFQPGSREVIVLRGRNDNPFNMDAMGSLNAHANGHALDPVVVWGKGRLDSHGRMRLPAVQQGSTCELPAVGAGGELVANTYVPAGSYVEVRYTVTWGNADTTPVFTFGEEDATAGVPVFRVISGAPAGLPAPGMRQVVAPGVVADPDPDPE